MHCVGGVKLPTIARAARRHEDDRVGSKSLTAVMSPMRDRRFHRDSLVKRLTHAAGGPCPHRGDIDENPVGAVRIKGSSKANLAHVHMRRSLLGLQGHTREQSLNHATAHCNSSCQALPCTFACRLHGLLQVAQSYSLFCIDCPAASLQQGKAGRETASQNSNHRHRPNISRTSSARFMPSSHVRGTQ